MRHLLESVADPGLSEFEPSGHCGGRDRLRQNNASAALPQYLLEDAHARGQHCRIVCSQPRRISATRVAECMAQERGEALGNSVGYAIRLQDVGGPRAPLRFVTYDILVQLLRSESAMEHVTHVVLDEMHERDRGADFSVILLLQELKSRPHLRLIIMSATLQVRCTA